MNFVEMPDDYQTHVTVFVSSTHFVSDLGMCDILIVIVLNIKALYHTYFKI